MQITVCSLNDFYKIDFTSNDMAVIRIFDTTEIENYLHRQRGKSIQEENTELLEKTRVKDVLTLFFDDIEPPYSKDKLLLIQYGILVPFSDEHLKQVIEFVEKNKQLDMIVHCYMGVSRSPAVAWGIYYYLNLISNGQYTQKLEDLEHRYFLMNRYIKEKFKKYCEEKLKQGR